MSDPPVVSGISPREGPPGTRVTIRGENLGSNRQDVTELKIHGESCLESLEYFSSKKLVCRTGSAVGPGTIIVTTLSGGDGSCTVSFCGLAPQQPTLLDPLEESDVWMDEDLDAVMGPGISVQQQSPKYTRRFIDPLGLTVDESRISKKKSSQDLEQMFPHGSGNLLSKDFNPVWYLLERHRFTSFQDLKLGLEKLESEVEKSDLAPVEFIRNNLDAFLQSYDTLSDVNELLIINESQSEGGSLTDKVEGLLQEAAEKAENLFQGVLKCKTRADATRNALMVLQRYRFLFNLPRSIEKNITNEEYDIVTNDYEKAKSLFAGTQVKVFKKVLEEVENQIRKLREDLRKKLHVLPSTLEEQKKLIKYLLELYCEGDPAWDCITNMHKWLLRLLFSSREEFQTPPRHTQHSSGDQTPMVALPDSESPIPRSEVPPRSRGHVRTISEVSTGSYGSQSTAYTATPAVRVEEGRPQKEWVGGSRDVGRPNLILFVEDLTGLISESLPDFWRLGQAYFSSTLFQGVSMLSEHQQQLAENRSKNQTRFESMVLEIVEVYTDMVRCSLFEDAHKNLPRSRRERLGEWVSSEDQLKEVSGAWLPQIVREMRECVSTLQTLSLPKRAVEMTQQLAFDIRKLCTDTLFYRAARDIEVLHEREDWQVHAEEGGIITSLPILFENRVVEVLLTLKEIVLETNCRETEEWADQPLLQASVEHFSSLLDHFASCFDYLAFQQEDDLHQECVSLASQGQDVAGVASMSDEAEGNSPPSEERLLMIMSNLDYMVTQVVPRLFDCFITYGYPPCLDLQESIIEQLGELDTKVFDAYIDKQRDCIVGITEQGMHAGFFDWEQCGEPTEVRNYIKDILLNLVLIHAEVYAVSSNIVERVLCQLVELLSDEFLRLIRKVENFSYNGSLYARIELSVLEDVLSPFLDDVSYKNFQQCKEVLGTIDTEGAVNVRKIVQSFKERTDMQLRCFKIQTEH